MIRDELKKEVLEVMELTEDYCRFLEGVESDAKRLTDLITRQDAYINSLTKFIEEITLSGGKYKHLNGDIIIADAYKILGG